MQFTDVLIHLDALGHMPSAALVGVGGIAFDLHSESDVTLMYRRVRLQSNGPTRIVDQETWDWWVQDQPYEPCEYPAAELPSILAELSGWISQMPMLERVWFWDITAAGILHHALEWAGMQRPWVYYTARDARTFLTPAFIEMTGAEQASPVGPTPEDQMLRRAAMLRDAAMFYETVFQNAYERRRGAQVLEA